MVMPYCSIQESVTLFPSTRSAKAKLEDGDIHLTPESVSPVIG